jgi:hypothetical protein
MALPGSEAVGASCRGLAVVRRCPVSWYVRSWGGYSHPAAVACCSAPLERLADQTAGPANAVARHHLPRRDCYPPVATVDPASVTEGEKFRDSRW